jgi:hypothetical protein
MHETLAGRAKELASLADLIRTSLSLADSAIPLINASLADLAEMGIDNVQIEGPLVYSRTTGYAPDIDDTRVLYAAALVMPYGLGFTAWDPEDHAMRYGESGHEPPCLKDRFVSFDQCPPILRATLPAHAPKLIIRLLQSFSVLTQ